MFSFEQRRGAERRVHARIAVQDGKATLTLTHVAGGPAIAVQLLDISLGGVRFRGHVRDGLVEKGASYELQLALEGAVLSLTGEVAWVESLSDGQTFVGGIRISHADRGTLARLEALLQQLAAPTA